MLALLAVPLSRSNPRQPRYAGLIVAILAYVVYANLLALGRAWLAQEQLAFAAGLWWVYLPTLALAAGLILRGQPLKRARRARKARA